MHDERNVLHIAPPGVTAARRSRPPWPMLFANALRTAGGKLAVWAVLNEDTYETSFGDGLYLHVAGISLNERDAHALIALAGESQWVRWHVEGVRTWPAKWAAGVLTTMVQERGIHHCGVCGNPLRDSVRQDGFETVCRNRPLPATARLSLFPKNKSGAVPRQLHGAWMRRGQAVEIPLQLGPQDDGAQVCRPRSECARHTNVRICVGEIQFQRRNSNSSPIDGQRGRLR